MTTSTSTGSALRTPSGNYAMLALDQRESLRAMFPRDASGAFVSDDALRRFKSDGIAALTPHASAVLLDRPFAVDGERPAGLAEGCGLIVAADVLHHQPGDPVSHTTVDPIVDAAFLRHVKADAVKFLVIWRAGVERGERARMIEQVMATAREAGVTALIEAIVRTDDDSPFATPDARHQAILDAAAEIAPFGPDVYKAEVPGYVPGDTRAVREHSERMSAIVPQEWVVLSNGVERADFEDAVAQARAGGAAGFLAGRAIWADLIDSDDHRSALETTSIPRLKSLTTIVDSM